MKMSAVIYFLLFFVSASCNRYIDRSRGVNKIRVMQGDFSFYADNNVLIYKSNIGLRKDNEISYSKPFYVKLPKGIKWYEVLNSTFFSFYYDNRQVITINTEPSSEILSLDTFYVPEKSELDKFTIAGPPSRSAKFDIGKIELKPDRRQLII